MPEQNWGRQDKYWGTKSISQIVWTRTIQLFRTQFLIGLNNLFFGQSKSYALRRPTSSANFNGDPFADQSVNFISWKLGQVFYPVNCICIRVLPHSKKWASLWNPSLSNGPKGSLRTFAHFYKVWNTQSDFIILKRIKTVLASVEHFLKNRKSVKNLTVRTRMNMCEQRHTIWFRP